MYKIEYFFESRILANLKHVQEHLENKDVLRAQQLVELLQQITEEFIQDVKILDSIKALELQHDEQHQHDEEDYGSKQDANCDLCRVLLAARRYIGEEK